MRLPKGVVKGIKDDFTLEKAEIKIRQQDLKIEKLEKQLARQRFFSLPKDEIEGVKRVFSIGGSPILNSLFGGRAEDEFLVDYMKKRDEDKKKELDDMYESGDLPF